MNKKIIHNTLITLFFTLTVFTNAMGQMVNSSFTYQGELIDNGVPASGQYDINLDLIDGDLNPWGSTSVHTPVEVVNGLFSVDAYFGISVFDGFKDFTVTVSVRKTSEGPGGAFTTLGSQTIQAVPLATNLTNGSATMGQVLTFNGFQWTPANPSAGTSSPWTVTNSEIYYTSGDVGIGITNPDSKLHVKSTDDLTAVFDGGSDMYVWFLENGDARGYMGSYQTQIDTSDEDFEIGTTSGSTGSMHIVTGNNDPRITVKPDGKVGINTLTPAAVLDVAGDTQLQGDVKQPLATNGVMKYMVSAKCSGTGAVINRSYNGVSTEAITIIDGGDVGRCGIVFPENISLRYFQATSTLDYNDFNGQYYHASNVVCSNINEVGFENILICDRFVTANLDGFDGDIMVLVY